MNDETNAELAERVTVLERELRSLRSRIDKSISEKGTNWVETVSGSMKDIPEDIYNRMMETGRALASGEIDFADVK